MLSMSPTVPPTSTRQISAVVLSGNSSSAACRMQVLIWSVIWGMIWTVSPRKSPRRSFWMTVRYTFPVVILWEAVELDIEEPLVIAEVKVDLAPVLEDEYFAVLGRVHGAGIDVQVRIDLDSRYPVAAVFQDPSY